MFGFARSSKSWSLSTMVPSCYPSFLIRKWRLVWSGRGYRSLLQHNIMLQTRASWMSLSRGGTRRCLPCTFLSERWPSLWMICLVSYTYLWQVCPLIMSSSIFDRDTVKMLLMTHLGILTEQEATIATSIGARVKLMWLTNLYHCCVESRSCMWATTTYLLHLIDNMIFTDKSSTHVHVAYLQYLDNLDVCHEYAWGVVALACLYDHLSYASQYNNK